VAVPIDIPVLVVGNGPGPLTVAKMVAGRGVPCLLAGHAVLPDAGPATLGPSAVEALQAHGLVDILLPYIHRDGASITISSETYEKVIKHHCVADINVVVYDQVVIVDRVVGPSGVDAVMTLGRSRWPVQARQLVDGSLLPTSLPDAIVAAADAVDGLLTPG
jgi:ribulose 1,5-bisphosphate synthetase/thiazole synthase